MSWQKRRGMSCDVVRTELGGRVVRRQQIGSGALVVGARVWASAEGDSMYLADRATVMTARLARPDFKVNAVARRGADFTIAYEWQRGTSAQPTARLRIDSRLVNALHDSAQGRQQWRVDAELY